MGLALVRKAAKNIRAETFLPSLLKHLKFRDFIFEK